jgi:hypothetical protein
MTVKALSAVAAALVLLAAASAQGERKEISFRRKKDNFLNLYCCKTAGKMRTSITCNGKLFTPDAEWEEINAEKVCFQNEDGRIRACDELSKLGSVKKSYACLDVSGKQSPFTPGKEWKRLAGNETICTEEWKRSDVPRNMTMPSLNLE